MTTENRLIDMAVLERAVPVLRSVVHPLRLRILDYLQCANEPRTVHAISESAGAAESVVSQQLRILKDQRILQSCRCGQNVYYQIINTDVLLLLECIRRQDKH